MYSFKNKCLQSDKLVLEDETLKVVFNTQSFSKENNLERKAILNYLNNNEAITDFTKKISTLVEDLKQSEKFKGEYMMINIRDYEIADRAKKEGIQQGFSQGAEQKAIETAKNLLTMNLSLEQIAQATSLPLEKIQELASEKTK
jgi:predicted transposase/invertase (TIGR01784 family)